MSPAPSSPAPSSPAPSRSCVFCAIVAGDAPAVLIHDDDRYLAFLDVRPFTRGHTLVVPKVHTVDLTDTPAATLAGMSTLGQRIARAARLSGLHADGNNIAINDGRAAFQSVFHIHLHVVPRRTGDRVAFAKGLIWRRDPDRETTGRILREALARLDETPEDTTDDTTGDTTEAPGSA
ncbi:HIT family hydrolase [Mycolicibacillus koreensis]|nr:HIT family hydrolase [Mycolicibacillus koreensis]